MTKLTANKPATSLPALARVSMKYDPFTVLGEVTPKGAPMRALLQIRDERTQLVAALRNALPFVLMNATHEGGMVASEMHSLLRSLGEDA